MIRPDNIKGNRLKLSEIPGARDAIVRAIDQRDAAFLDLTTTICGQEILPMTVRHWIILDGIDSPFVCGRLPQLHDVPMFLWTLSPQFRPGASWRRGRFIRAVSKHSFPEAAAACIHYVQDTFQDAPPRDGGSTGSLPQISFAAGIVARLAHAFHWHEETILRLPLKRAYQYLKAVDMINDPDGAKFQPWDGIVYSAMREAREKAKTGGRG